MSTRLARRSGVELHADPNRVITRLFLPGEEARDGRSRVGSTVSRVLGLAEDEVEDLVAELRADFATRHADYEGLLTRHAALVASHLPDGGTWSASRLLLIGAAFTSEFAIEGAALCNPSALLHPDQTGVGAGAARVAVSVRAIGEGHFSSIGFVVAIVGPGTQWSFLPRRVPAVAGTPTPGRWQAAHLRAVLGGQTHIGELGLAILDALPAEFDGHGLERVIAGMHPDLLGRHGGTAMLDLLRRLVSSAYEVEFAPALDLSQQVLAPFTADESNGMEDARFTRFVDDSGEVAYRATYVAYDGKRIAPRLLRSGDLRGFSAQSLAGPGAQNKGMALFPRLVGGRHLALCRTDGESLELTSSLTGLVWEEPAAIYRPRDWWSLLQVGNCGPPIETDRGWLVLIHGVGPMRVYRIGAILLDLDDPRKVVAMLPGPLLEPERDERDGYVPNVVYSCGGVVHDGVLWLPYGIDDARIGVASVDMDALLDAMRPCG